MSIRRSSVWVGRHRSRALHRSVEALERRQMLCADSHAALGLVSATERDLPPEVASMFVGGHITPAQYASLPADVKARIDPHEVGDPGDQAPIDYDAILGIPEYPDGPPAGEADENLPDFFPGLTGGVSVDQTSQSGRTLLRFGTRVHNQGTGPASLISGRPGIDPIPTGAPITSWVNPDGSQNVLQGVYRWTGSTFTLSYYRAAGQFTYHAGHGHFHFDGYAFYRLRARNPDGTPGAYITRNDGTEVVGTKTGFCLINTTSSFIMENGQSSTTLTGYSSSSPYNGQPTMSCGLMQGVRVGMADDYSSSLEGQWIDVTGVPNGQYFIEISLDGENAVLESNENNNAKSFAYTLNVNNPGGGITPDTFDVGGNNNTLAAAHDMGELGTFTQTGLSIHYGQDFDWFKFRATSSGTYTITTTGVSGNLDLYLFDAVGNQLRASTGTSSSESVSYPFVQGDTYYVRAEAYNSTLVSNYQIAWNLKPLVTNQVDQPNGSELGAVPATFVISRNGPTTSPLSVTFALGGTAIEGVDYRVEADGLINPTTISLGDLQSSVVISIVPLTDALVEATETVTLTVTSNNAYVIGGAPGGTVTIADTPPQVLGSSFGFNAAPHAVSFDFSLDVSASLGIDDISVLNLDTNQPVAVTGVNYGGRNDTGTFSFGGLLPDGNYRATLNAAGVTHALGAPLSQNAVLEFFVLAGDANRDRSVNIADFGILAARFNQSGGFTDGDFDYSGTVDIADFSILASRFNTTLQPPGAGRPGVSGGAAAPGVRAAAFSSKLVALSREDAEAARLVDVI